MPFDLGDIVPLSIEIHDQNGALADATAVTLTVTKPDRTTETPAVTHPSTGIYRCDYTPAVAGPYRVRWVATGTNASSTTDAFDVREDTPLLMFSLTDARNMLNRSNAADNEKIRDLIESTTSIVEDIVGPVVPRTVTEVIRPSGNFSYFVLNEVPVISLTSITPVINGTPTYDITDFDIDGETGVIQEKVGRGVVGMQRIVYVSGRTILPAAIRDAGRMTLRYLWSMQIGPHSGPRDMTAPIASASNIQTLGRELPPAVLELLRPYAKTGGFA